MERLWELGERVVLAAARWLICPDRRVEQVPDLPSPEQIKDGLAVDDTKKVRETLDFCKWLFEREEERTRTLESKAVTLTGFTGLTTAFVSGFAALLLDAEKIPCKPAMAAFVLLYVLVVMSFTRTILCALRVVRVGDPYFLHILTRGTYPSSRQMRPIASVWNGQGISSLLTPRTTP